MRLFILLLVATAGPAFAQGNPKAKTKPGDERDAVKDRLLKDGGGTAESEAAVARGLAWLAGKQLKDGSWEFDGSKKQEKEAATGLALLPFLAAGEGPKDGKRYRDAVKKGLDWLTTRVQKDGALAVSKDMYAHAIATLALCDGYASSKDAKLKQAATRGVVYILKAQAPNGSWGYKAGGDGDTSIVGWQIQALAAAERAGIEFDKSKPYKNANKFLDSVSIEKGARYGYKDKGGTPSLSAVGLLNRLTTGEYTPGHAAVANGVEFLKKTPPRKGFFDVYYYYYATRVMFLVGGDDWHKEWNPKMRDLLVETQSQRPEKGLNGSWDADRAHVGLYAGRLGTTALALLTLEVYYRYPPADAKAKPEKK